jgi:hypothetical protein
MRRAVMIFFLSAIYIPQLKLRLGLLAWRRKRIDLRIAWLEQKAAVNLLWRAAFEQEIAELDAILAEARRTDEGTSADQAAPACPVNSKPNPPLAGEAG